MRFLAILSLTLLAFVNYTIGKKSIFYPPLVFCFVWAATLVVIWIAGDFYYPLLPETLLIFSCGGLAFSLGSALAFGLPPLKPRNEQAFLQSSNRILSVLLLLVLLGTPVAVRWVLQAISEHQAGNFLAAAYLTMIDKRIQESFGYSLFHNFLDLAIAVALIAFYEKESGKKRAVLSIILALALSVITGGRNAFVPLILSIVCLDWIKSRRIRLKLFTVLAIVLITLVSSVALYVGKANANPDASLTENTVPLVKSLVLYSTGGPVAYDRVVRAPQSVPHSLPITIFFTHLLHKIDASFQEPYTDMDWQSTFVCTGPGECGMNVYTFYFSYIDFGYLPMMAIVIVLGFLVTTFYKKAILGSKICALTYAVLFPGVVLSLFQEYFFRNLNFLLKICIVVWLVYSLPVMWSRFKKFVKRAVEVQLIRYEGS